jgi:hypothetical protein
MEVGAGVASSDDLIDLDLCRNFVVSDNVSVGGSENALDLLSCINGTVTGNSFSKVDVVGIAMGIHGWYMTHPEITLSKKYLKCENITISGNFIESKRGIDFWMGSNINVVGNTYKPYTGSTIWSPYGSNGTVFANFSTVSPIPTLWGTNPELRPANIKFSGNKWNLGPKYLVTADADTDQLTTSVAHDFVTGESVELLVGGNVTTVKLPTGKYSTTWITDGTHNGPNNSATLIDTTKNFCSLGVVKGMWVVNVTDGSQGRITDITTTTNPNDTLTATLAGGAENDWDTGDAYQFRLPYCGVTGSYTPPAQPLSFQPYWVIRVDDTHIKLATSYSNAFAGNAIDILDAGGGSGQELYVRRSPSRLVANDGYYRDYANWDTIELEPEMAMREIRLFNGYTGETFGDIKGFKNNIAFEYILDPGLNYTGNKSALPKYVKMPPFFYHAGDAKSYGMGVQRNEKYYLGVYTGDRIIKYTGAPTADTCGFIRIRWY